MPTQESVSACRAAMAGLLAHAVSTTLTLEQRLGTHLAEDTSQTDLETDPFTPSRSQVAVLLRKARIHIAAVLRANAANNIHSLGVQARPALESAGQIVFLSRTLLTEPGFGMEAKRARQLVVDYVNADYYGTMIRATKGELGHDELVATARDAEESAAVRFGFPKPRQRPGRSLKQHDKVSSLKGGKNWYDFLSEYFCHGRSDWRGPLWHGGVTPTNTIQGEFAFFGMLSYLVEQVAVMNSSAVLWPLPGENRKTRCDQWVKPTLEQLRRVRESSQSIVKAALQNPERGADGNAGAG